MEIALVMYVTNGFYFRFRFKRTSGTSHQFFSAYLFVFFFYSLFKFDLIDIPAMLITKSEV